MSTGNSKGVTLRYRVKGCSIYSEGNEWEESEWRAGIGQLENRKSMGMNKYGMMHETVWMMRC